MRSYLSAAEAAIATVWAWTVLFVPDPLKILLSPMAHPERKIGVGGAQVWERRSASLHGALCKLGERLVQTCTGLQANLHGGERKLGKTPVHGGFFRGGLCKRKEPWRNAQSYIFDVNARVSLYIGPNA